MCGGMLLSLLLTAREPLEAQGVDSGGRRRWRAGHTMGTHRVFYPVWAVCTNTPNTTVVDLFVPQSTVTCTASLLRRSCATITSGFQPTRGILT